MNTRMAKYLQFVVEASLKEEFEKKIGLMWIVMCVGVVWVKKVHRCYILIRETHSKIEEFHLQHQLLSFAHQENLLKIKEKKSIKSM